MYSAWIIQRHYCGKVDYNAHKEYLNLGCSYLPVVQGKAIVLASFPQKRTIAT